ncbi:MAG TPA: hypothetical protein DCY86_19715, partial [Bdellovibrionales bacterium]|nr:hypothetical protein [Bdellovibrionales bacterium]
VSNDGFGIKEEIRKNKHDEFLMGKHMGLITALSLFYQQALAFKIDPREIGFKHNDKDPDEYLL